MRYQLFMTLILLVVAGAFAVLNPDLVYQPSLVNTGLGARELPSIAALLVFAAASWIVLLLGGLLAEWRWQRSAAVMETTMAVKDREILQLKASAFDQLQDILRSRIAAPEPSVVIDRRSVDRTPPPGEPQPALT